jgi:DNA-binding MarR family transcriptional regulator
MTREVNVDQVAGSLRLSLGLLIRRLRQVKSQGELTLPEISVLARLDRDGPTTVTALAKLEQISAQSMGATLAALETRGLVARASDPGDGRRVVMSATDAGLDTLQTGRNARLQALARALAIAFSPAELETLREAAPLIERLAQNI